MCGNFQWVGMVKINTGVEENNGRITIEWLNKIKSCHHTGWSRFKVGRVNELNIITAFEPAELLIAKE